MKLRYHMVGGYIVEEESTLDPGSSPEEVLDNLVQVLTMGGRTLVKGPRRS